MKVAVIGAGLAGAVITQELQRAGVFDVAVFEKSRGIGGRMTTRRGESIAFDHGAQFFTARNNRFKKFLKPFIDAGVVAEWNPKVTTLSPLTKSYKRIWYEPHYVASPQMNTLCKQILAGVEVETGREVKAVYSQGQHWQIIFEDDSVAEKFDWVISTAPAEQTVKLFATEDAELQSVSFSSCFALMVHCEEPPPWQAAVVKDSPISWCAFTDSKPGRELDVSLVAHASAQWSDAHFDSPREQVAELLLSALAELGEFDVISHQLHRWRYARTVVPLGRDYWLADKTGLAACGDWCLGDRVEDAYMSAHRLAEHLIGKLQLKAL